MAKQWTVDAIRMMSQEPDDRKSNDNVNLNKDVDDCSANQIIK